MKYKNNLDCRLQQQSAIPIFNLCQTDLRKGILFCLLLEKKNCHPGQTVHGAVIVP